MIFFAEKMWVAFALSFNESLTNDIISFEQLGPEGQKSLWTVWMDT